jgi:acetyl/propionyl-CoA carboxylase alpha subunit
MRAELTATESWIEQRDALLQLDAAALSADIGLQRALGGGYESPQSRQHPIHCQAKRHHERNHRRTGGRRARKWQAAQDLMLIAAIFIVGCCVGLYWVLVLAKREDTDDAYVNGNKVVISAQISGTVVAVLTDDTQLVKAGQVLVRLDPIDAATA